MVEENKEQVDSTIKSINSSHGKLSGQVSKRALLVPWLSTSFDFVLLHFSDRTDHPFCRNCHHLRFSSKWGEPWSTRLCERFHEIYLWLSTWYQPSNLVPNSSPR